MAVNVGKPGTHAVQFPPSVAPAMAAMGQHTTMLWSVSRSDAARGVILYAAFECGGRIHRFEEVLFDRKFQNLEVMTKLLRWMESFDVVFALVAEDRDW